MEKELLVALITAFAALIAALISFIASIFTAIKVKQANIDTEILKLNNDRIRMLFDINYEVINERINSINLASESVQIMRDEIRNVVLSIDNGSEINITNAFDAVNNIIHNYQQVHPYLLGKERKIFHGLKNTTTKLAITLDRIRIQIENNESQFESSLINELNQGLETLTNGQNDLLQQSDNMINFIGKKSQTK